MRAGVFCLMAALAGCSSGGTTERPGLRVAEEALRAGSPEIALQVAQGVLSQAPDDVPALLIQGEANLLTGKTDEAGTAFQHALRLKPNSVPGKLGLGRLRLSTDTAEAMSLFQDVLKQEPRNLSALNNLGIARDLLGDHQQAQEAYRQVLAIDPANGAAKVNLALSMAMSGNANDAIALIAPLATAAGATPRLRHDYAVVLAMAGKEGEAERILRTDLSSEQVKQVLAALRQQRSGGS